MQKEIIKSEYDLFTAILTPMNKNGELALEHVPSLFDFQRSAGIDGVVVCGTNGEGTSLSVNERKLVLEAAQKYRGSLRIVAGTGAGNLPDTIELTRHAAETGAESALVLPPFFFKSPTAQGAADYFRRVLDASSIPILLYSIPHFTAVPITNNIIDLLIDHPNLAGLKDSAGDLNRTRELITRYPHLKIYSGSDYITGPAFMHGSFGCISGGANAFPELLNSVRNAHKLGLSSEDQAAAQHKLTGMTDICVPYPLIATNKSIAAMRNVCRISVRSPLVDLTPEQEKNLHQELQNAGYL